MVAIKSHQTRLFEEKLLAFREALVFDLTAGAPGDYPTYRSIVGRLQGLDDARKIAEDVDLALSGEG